MARPEPFRSMLEEAVHSTEGAPVKPSKPVPREISSPALDKKLDQIALAGVSPTPPRGTPRDIIRGARLDPLPAPPAPLVTRTPAQVASATAALLEEFEITRKLELPAAVDAAIQDSLAASNATREIPAARMMPALSGPFPAPTLSTSLPPTLSPLPPAAAPRAPLPELTPLNAAKPASTPPKLAPMPELSDRRRASPAPVEVAPPVTPKARPAPPPLPPLSQKPPAPPPLAMAAPVPVPVATMSPAPTLTAPPPKITRVLTDDATIPGLPTHSSTSGKVITQAELYRLQLEFEDTPARPLPALASLVPLPVLPSADPTAVSALIELGDDDAELELVDLASDEGDEDDTQPHSAHPEARPVSSVSKSPPPQQLIGVEASGANRFGDLEHIENLDDLAMALGLKSVHDVSIPSGDGEPVTDDAIVDASDADDAPPRTPSGVRRARVMKALGAGSENVFLDEAPTNPGLPAGKTHSASNTQSQSSSSTSTASVSAPPSSGAVGARKSPPRPPLPTARAVSPVIVKIPSRPKVSQAAKEQGRKLYMNAVEALSKGEKAAAVSHMRLAIHYDDSVQLYRDFLAQLERKSSRSDEKPVRDIAREREKREAAGGDVDATAPRWRRTNSAAQR